jgi:predicted permease
MTSLLQDVRYGLRQLRKSPGFTLIAVFTLALGIGATTAMFSLVDGALFRSLRYPHADQLASVGVIAPIIDGEFLFAANYLAWRRDQTPFASLTSSTGVNDCDLTDDRPVRSTCASVASTFLPTFGVQPILGRNFTPEEDRPDSPKVALLTYGLWQSRFGGDRGVVDRTISLDGRPTRVLGVLPRDFEFPTLARTGLVVPEALDESIVQRNLMGPTVRVYGRLKPGVSIESAAAQLQPLFRSFVESAPPPFRKELRLQVRSIRDLQIHDSRLAAWLLLISAFAVLPIACANVANLVFARSTGRRHELAVRSALGAARVRLFQQRLTESMLLALVGGAIGCGLAYLIVHGFVALSPAGIPRLLEATVNVRVLIFVLLSSSIAAVAFGTLPALEKPRPEALVAMTVAGTRRTNLRKALMAAQVWMTLILVTGALLFLRSLRNLEVQLLGMNTQNIVTAAITLGQQKYAQPAQRLAFFEALEQKLQQLPGVAAVALSDSLPPDTPARTIDPQTVAKELRDSIATLDPTLPVESSTLGQTVYRLAERPRFTAALLSLFAGVGLVLAAVGIFGLVSLLVSQRTREIAIRLALGANPATVTRVMVFQTLVWIAGGAIAGTFCSLVAARWIGALLFEIKPNDPATLTEAALLLLAVALLASYIPPRRTAKVDPMVALRYE